MKCAYCGRETKGTREHIISSGILDLFPECYITFDDTRKKIYQADPTVKDVCAECNNQRISYIDSYAKDFISRYFTRKYTEQDKVEIEYNYVLVQKMLLKYAFNDVEILHYLLNENDKISKTNVTVLCGLAVNVSPAPDAMFGNLKLRWCQNPILYSNSVVRHIDYVTGQVFFNKNVPRENFPDLKLSYLFKFNSVQFLLMCWERGSEKIDENNMVLSYQYPYHLLKADEGKAKLPVCTDEFNYHQFEHVNVKWDGLFEVGLMRKLASGGEYKYKNFYEKEWEKQEEKLRKEHPR